MTQPPAARQRRPAVSTKNLLWLVPLVLAIIAVSAILALPGFVSSGYHRATIEALASSLTGRTVHIKGKLSLALLPHPQFIAGDITITSPNNETITASSLTLDIAPIPLLHGQISARAITLQSPHIALPWPLPNGAAAIAPPPWLTALHAQINNGQISLGAATFTHVSADIFTGGQGTFSVSGSGELAGAPVTLSLSFGAISAVGSTPLTLDIQTNNAADLRAHVTGTFDAASTLSGKASFSAAPVSWLDPALSQPLSGTAAITAEPRQILLSSLQIRQGRATLSGTATLSLPQPDLSLVLTGTNLTLPPSIPHLPSGFAGLPIHLTLYATGTRIATHPAFSLTNLQTSLDFNDSGTRISSLTASLADAALSLSGTLDPAGDLQAQAEFNSTALNSVIGGPGPVLPAGWSQASLKCNLTGTADHLSFDQISGSLGPARVSGSAVLTARSRLSGQLHFDQLDLTPFIALALHPPSAFAANRYTGDFEITADRASLGQIPLTHLLADGSLGSHLIVRRLSASAYGGIAAGSFTLTAPAPAGSSAPTAQITSARAILALPSAAPLDALLPPAWRAPAALTKAPLALSFLAAGPADALATSAVLTLGDVSITASPMIDLLNQSSAGAFTLRHPDAIAAFKAFGLNAGLAWPGAGSIALRANLLLSPTQMGFSDFVLSMGDLTANGRLTYGTNHSLNGQIDADTLALPPVPADFAPLWAYLDTLQGKIGISANRMLVAGNPLFGPVAGNITLSPGKFDLDVSRAQLANGNLTGAFSATLPVVTVAPVVPDAPDAPVAPVAGKPGPALAPAISAKFTLTGADAAALNLNYAFPITLSSGTLNAAIDLTASGYAPPVWLATLSGNASLAASAGSLNGFNLPGLITALKAPKGRASQLRTASLTGATPFDHVSLSSSLNNGVATLTSADLQSQSGKATASGNIDLPDCGVTLTLTLQPAVPVPPKLTLTLDGSWQAPRKIAAIKSGLSWRPATKH
jgi:uncharacterized protein involved in outer membrane biogenesis